MVNANPNNAYLTEQTRLEAQRRMLAERYGLYSDESDDGDDAPRSSTASSSAPESLNGASSNHSTSAAAGAPLPPANANGRPTAVTSTSAPSAAVTDPSSSADPPSTLTVTTLALPAAGGSSVVDTPAINTSFSPDEVHDSPPSISSSPPPTEAWPPVEIVDPAQGNRVRSRFCVPRSGVCHSAANARVTQITHYSSQLLETHQRKIAINEQIMSYGVGGHVRTMLRHGPARYLLKGHNSVVADIEFLSFVESQLDMPSVGHVSILGSVAEDGSVYVWKLIRNVHGDTETLDVADAIRFEHPDFDKGRSYKRIAFRPGPNSIIAENGIGVAMLLLDVNSTDLRIVEVVKMNDKMMVRDKFLRARHEHIDSDEKAEGNVSAAAWFSETVVVTSRGGHVFLWNADNTYSCCIGHVPRENTLPVTAIYTLQEDVMLFVISHGRQLEVWSVTEIGPEMTTITLQLNQTLTLFDEDKPDVHCVAAVDPSNEIVTISNVRQKSLFVLHFNFSAKAFDGITEIPLKQSIHSFCIAPISEASLPPLQTTSSRAPRTHQDPVKETGVWCVQPLGIQVVHLPLHLCRPLSNVTPEVYPKPVPKTIRGKMEKKPLMSANQGSSPKTSQDASSVSSKRLFMPNLPPKTGAGVDSGGTVQTMSGSGKGGLSGPLGGNPSSNSQSKGFNDTRGRGGSGSDSESKGVRNNSEGGAKKPMSMTSISAPQENHPFSGDEIVEVLLNAAKKVIATFEEAAPQRTANEKAKTDKLMESVAETAESNMERFINSSMKKVLAETLIPGVSEIIADSRKAMKEKAKFEGKLAREHFEEVLEKADINKSLGNACNEMCRQVTDAVSQSLSSKYETMVQPIVNTVNDATEDLTTSLTLLRSEVSKLKEDVGNNTTESIIEIEPEDVRRTIEEQVREGHVDEAFLTALDKQDVPLVMWLCSKFEVSTFFVDHSLSQTALLSLAAQLGQELEEGEVMLKVDWLREVILALEPEAEEIEPVSQETMQFLEAKINDLRKNKEFMDEHPGLERKFKTVAKLVTSHIQN